MVVDPRGCISEQRSQRGNAFAQTPAQISRWNPAPLPQPREFLSEIFAFLFLWGNEGERRREKKEVCVWGMGGLQKLNHHGNFNNISLPLALTHAQFHAHGEEMSFKKKLLVLLLFIYLTPAEQQRHHWPDKGLVTVLLLILLWHM